MQLGFWFFTPKEWPHVKKLGILFGLGFLFVIIVAPFIFFLYLPGQPPVTADQYRLQMYILNTFYPNNLAEVPEILMKFLEITLLNGVLPAAIVSIVLLSAIKKILKSDIHLVFIWIIAILTFSHVPAGLEISMQSESWRSFCSLGNGSQELIRFIRPP